ncbi:thiamine pyrophosphate-dependent enzyme [Amycolatopsis pigmentata]|uniref:Thiamine pyrophosphate-dependent enzyme n=1 Tax=Amycolatopsis pigmentata TaxID=450801 RepID=A0ABW5FNU3_9PSEU
MARPPTCGVTSCCRSWIATPRTTWPDRTVVCVLGDGDFLMTAQEIALSVTMGAPVVFVVQNNAGYMSIRGGQRKQTSRHIGTEFSRPDGSPYSPDFAAPGASFGIESWKVSDPDSLEPTLRNL